MNRYDTINTKQNFVFTDFDLCQSQLVTTDPIFSLLAENYTDASGKVIESHPNNDIMLLFNQERIEKTLGTEIAKRFIDQMQPKQDALKELRKKVSDSDLLKICKSRYIQTPSELLSWSQYLNDNYETLVDEIRATSVVNEPTTPTTPTDEPNTEPTT